MTNKDSLKLKNWLLKVSSKGPLNKNFTASKLDKLRLDLEVVDDAYRILNWPVASVEPFWIAHLESDLWKDIKGAGSRTKKTMAWLRLVKHLVDLNMIEFQISSSNTFYWSVRMSIKEKHED